MVIIRIFPSDTSDYEDAQKYFFNELPWRLPSEARVFTPYFPDGSILRSEEPIPGIGGGGESIELLIALAGASGAVITATLTALYTIINKYMDRNANREITIEKDGRRITLKGHALPESRKLLEVFYPEVFLESSEPARSRVEELSEEFHLDIWLATDIDEDK